MDKLVTMMIGNDLKEQGFSYIRQVINADMCFLLKKQINKRLEEFINFHASTEQQYFSAVNRWPLNSVIDTALLQELLTQLGAVVSKISELELHAYEMDVLYKSTFADLGTPCHQDIAYAHKRPYAVSSWMPLTAVANADSPLQLLPGSHQKPISPAIDFWQPEFVDEFRQTIEWQQQAINIAAEAGDTIIFSSRLWHGSLKHQSSNPRLTIVVRWGNEDIAYDEIPLPKPVTFGMWNCGEYTQALLQKGLKEIYNIQEEHFLAAIKIWQKQLILNKLPFICDNQRAFIALEKLCILNQAYQAYGGGDGQGIVYTEVCKYLLLPLQTYLAAKNNQP